MTQEVYPEGGLAPGTDDLPVTPQQMLAIPLFCGANASKLGKCQGAMVLRIFKEANQIICRQGAAGMSAYFILSQADVYGLYAHVETKLHTVEATLQAAQNPTEELRDHVQKGQTIRDAYRAKLPFLGDAARTALLKAAHNANITLVQHCRKFPEHRHLLSDNASAKRDHADMVRKTPELAELAASLLNAAAVQDDTPAAFVYRHAVRESTVAASSVSDVANARQVTLYESELFGEMACKNRQPRAADVRTARPCYVLEMLSNVLDILEEDKQFRNELRTTYEQRVLELHLREFSLFRHLPEDQFMAIYGQVRSRLNVDSYKAGKAGKPICEEGAASDAVFLIRRGWVQVKVRQGSQQQVIAYRGPGEFIGEMGLIRTPEQIADLKKGDFTGALATMPQPGPRTATCVAFGHPDGKGEVELLHIPYEELWKLIKASPGIREEIVFEAERRRNALHRLPLVPDVKGSANVLFNDALSHLGLYQGQSLMLIDLDRCTRCDECVRACVDTHQDGRSRLFLVGPRAQIDARTFLVPTTCQSCEDPVCMIDCPTRAIRRGDGGEMVINEKTCIGCSGCANKCPYNAIQMHDLGLITTADYLNPRVAGDKGKKDDPSSYDWYCFPSAEIAEKESATWRTQTAPPRGWLACSLPVAFDREFRKGLAAAARRQRQQGGPEAISPHEMLCFWRAFSVPFDRQDWDGHVVLEMESPPESFKVWIDGNAIDLDDRDSNYHHHLQKSAKGWRWWRKEDTHVLALQVIPKCEPCDTFLGHPGRCYGDESEAAEACRGLRSLPHASPRSRVHPGLSARRHAAFRRSRRNTPLVKQNPVVA